MQLKTLENKETVINDYTYVTLHDRAIALWQDDNIITIVTKSELKTLIALLTAAMQEYED